MLLLVCCTAAVRVGNAADASMQLSAGLGYTDNAARTDNGAAEETFADVTLGGAIDRQGGRLAAGAHGLLSYHDYLSGDTEGEVLGQMSANLQYQIVPGRLVWSARDDLSEYRADPLEADAPGNRALLNNFETGPELTLRFGNRGSLVLSGEYGRTWDQENVISGSQYSGEASLVRALGAGQSLSLAASYEKLEFGHGIPGFDSRNLDVVYALTGSRTSLDVFVGRGEIDDLLGRKVSMRAGLNASRRITPSLSLSAALDYSFSSAQAALREVVDDTVETEDNGLIIASASGFRNRSARISAQYTRRRTAMNVQVRYSSPQYRLQPEFNRRFVEIGTRIRRSIGQRSTIELRANWLRARYKFISLDNDEGVIAAAWSVRAGKRVFFRLDGEHAFRARPDNLDEYTENRVLLSVGLQAGSGT